MRVILTGVVAGGVNGFDAAVGMDGAATKSKIFGEIVCAGVQKRGVVVLLVMDFQERLSWLGMS